MPYYAQLRELLEADIRGGRLEVGAQLPSEAELCGDYDVSRTVVRQALMELANEGLIIRVKGKGSFVARPKVDEHLAQNLVGLADEVSARGQHLENQILVFEQQLPPEHIAENLGLGSQETVVRLDRLRFINGEPWVVTATYLPHSLCAALLDHDMRHRSLYATMEEELGLVVDHGRRTIEAALAGQERGALLGIEPAAPVLLLRSIGYLADGRPIEYFVAWHRGDRSRFDVDLARRGSLRSGPVSPGNGARGSVADSAGDGPFGH
jgi:GntR family transcriptional regulator, N-acetylglucosamine utilization regulator